MKKRIFILTATTILTFVNFVSCGMSDAAKKVNDKIADLPNTYSADADKDISEAQAAYDELSDEDKASIDHSKLDSLNSEKNTLMEKVKPINDDIAKLNSSAGTMSAVGNEFDKANDILKKIKNLSKEEQGVVDWDSLSQKTADISSKATSIVADITSKAQSIDSEYSVLQSYSSTLLKSYDMRGSVAMGYVMDFQSALNDFPIVKQNGEVSQKINELKGYSDELFDAIAFDNSSDIITYSIKITSKLPDLYNAAINDIDASINDAQNLQNKSDKTVKLVEELTKK